MKPTRLQRKMLKVYPRYETGGFTIRQVARVCWKQCLAMPALGLLFPFLLTPASPPMGWLYVDLIGGTLLRGAGYYQVAFRITRAASKPAARRKTKFPSAAEISLVGGDGSQRT
jgi:uncharacterized membrane protein YedE/YeeE